jgi:hypothetical protein
MVLELVGIGVGLLLIGVILYKILQKAISLAIKGLIIAVLLSGIYFFLTQTGVLEEVALPIIISVL